MKEESKNQEQGQIKYEGIDNNFKEGREHLQLKEPKQDKDWKISYIQYLNNGTLTGNGAYKKDLQKMACWSRKFFMEEEESNKIMPNGEVKIGINEEVKTLVRRLHDHQRIYLSTNLTWQLAPIGPY